MFSVASLLCSSCAKTHEVKRQTVAVSVGTPIKLILIDQLESGVSPEGSSVSLVVADDVRSPEGSLIFVKGASAKGRVIWSRRGQTLAALANQPARLAIGVDQCTASDGSKIQITVRSAVNQSDRLQLTRANNAATSSISEPLTEAQLSGLKSDFDQLFTAIKDNREAEARSILAHLSVRPDLHGRLGPLEKGGQESLLKALRLAVGSSRFAGPIPMAGQALELIKLSGQVGNRVARMLRARNIIAFPGTEITAFTSEPGQVLAP